MKVRVALICLAAIVTAIAVLLTGGLLHQKQRVDLMSGDDRIVFTRYPNPYSDIQPFMEGFYAASHDASISVASNTRVLIVPHHLVASKTIAIGISSLAKTSFKRIVLLSPDHFDQCPTVLCTTNGIFDTYFGSVSSSPQSIKTLIASPLVTVEPNLFKQEHGIYAVLPFIEHNAPGVDVTPIVLSQKIPWKGQKDSLLQLLNSIVDDQTMLIVSSDFSHYLSLSESNQKDALTEQAIRDQNLDAIASLENPQQSDCPGCLWLAASIAKGQNCKEPNFLLHTNSATILKDESALQTTSHYAIQWFNR